MLVDHLESVVSQLCLVHQVIHQRLHHLSRAYHILQRSSRLRGEDEQFVHHLCQILAFFKQYLNALVQFGALSLLLLLDKLILLRFGQSPGSNCTFALELIFD